MSDRFTPPAGGESITVPPGPERNGTHHNPWKRKATGSGEGMIADRAELARALALFADPDLGCEVMALTVGAFKNRPGSDVAGLIAGISDLPGGIGIYFRVNPVPVGLSHPAKNEDVVKRRWLYIDVDPVKAEGETDNPATDDEKNRTGAVLDEVVGHLHEKGWPGPVVTDSGNGFGLFYRVDLPNDQLVRSAYQRLLLDLSTRFSGANGTIDKSIHNPNRLAKLPGTWARKGVASSGRPHRPCRLLVVPRSLELVSYEMIAAAGVGEPGTAQPPGSTPPPTPPSSSPGPTNRNTSAYARKALDNECARVALSRPPARGGDGRNNALNRAAFSLGQLVGSGLLTEGEVKDGLYAAACAAGLDADPGCGTKGVWATIERGLAAGRKEPREPKGRPDPRATFPGRETFKEDVKAGKKKLTIGLSQITPLQVEWLVPHRVPKRFVTVFAGRTGIGKSFVACDLIARLSTGGEIPGAGGQCFEPGGTLIISEDSHEYVLAPRLISLGANLDRIHAMTWEAMGNYFLGDTDMLSEACDEVPGGVSLVLVDPPTNFLDEVDEHKNSEVRHLIMKVVEWCFGRDLATIFVLHVNKQTGKGIEAINRVMGSVAWVSTARIAHSFSLDPEDSSRGLWVPAKTNLGQLAKGLAYRIGNAEGGASVEWCGEVDTTADEAMAGARSKKRRSVSAAVWLAEQFEGVDKLPSDSIWRDKDEFTTLSRNALLEAKDEMGIKARQEADTEGDRKWYWHWSAESRTKWEEKQSEPPAGG